MNQAQLDRRVRFAEMARRQEIVEAKRQGTGQLAIAQLGKTPSGKCWSTDPTRNLHMRFPSHQMFTQGVFHVEHWRGGVIIVFSL